MNPTKFFTELKRRNVYKVAAAYAVVGWLLIQVATQVFPFLEIPNKIAVAYVAGRAIMNRAASHAAPKEPAAPAPVPPPP
jgi:hypothetical protein